MYIISHSIMKSNCEIGFHLNYSLLLIHSKSNRESQKGFPVNNLVYARPAVMMDIW